MKSARGAMGESEKRASKDSWKKSHKRYWLPRDTDSLGKVTRPSTAAFHMFRLRSIRHHKLVTAIIILYRAQSKSKVTTHVYSTSR